MSYNEWTIQTVPARYSLGTVRLHDISHSFFDLFNIAHLHGYSFLVAGGMSDDGIRLALVGVFLVVAYALLFHGQLGWDRLLWKAGPGTSNRKNNHFWDIRTIMCFSVSLYSQPMCHAEIRLDCVALFSCLSITGFTHTISVSLGKALISNSILTSINHLLPVRVSTAETERTSLSVNHLPLAFLDIVLITYSIMSTPPAQHSAAKPSSGAASTPDKWPSWYGQNSQCFCQRQLELTIPVVSTSKKL